MDAGKVTAQSLQFVTTTELCEMIAAIDQVAGEYSQPVRDVNRELCRRVASLSIRHLGIGLN